MLNLVQLELAQKQAEETKVSVTDADVAAEREFTLKKMFADAEKADYDKLFEQFLTQQRITRPEFDIVMRINVEANKALQSAEMKDKLLGQGAEAVGNPPEFFADYIRTETTKWAKVVKDSGAKVD